MLNDLKLKIYRPYEKCFFIIIVLNISREKLKFKKEKKYFFKRIKKIKTKKVLFYTKFKERFIGINE